MPSSDDLINKPPTSTPPVAAVACNGDQCGLPPPPPLAPTTSTVVASCCDAELECCVAPVPHPSAATRVPFDEKLADALETLRETFRRYRIDEIFLSFNGGKDCTVLLHLADTVLRELHEHLVGRDHPPLLCLYLQTVHPFEEVDHFVEMCTLRYNIQLVRSLPALGQSKQRALFDLCAARPKLRACLMGCRRSDPWCERLGTFEETTAGWPALMRVNPLLEWTCADVWDYVERFAVPYCELYDVGYTSLGDKTNTLPNPHLRHTDPITGLVAYKPAHTLRHNDELERVGRFVPDSDGSSGSGNGTSTGHSNGTTTTTTTTDQVFDDTVAAEHPARDPSS